MAFGRVLTDLLFEVAPSDPATFVVVALALAGAGLVAVLLPARRAVNIDPATALRSD